MYTPKLNLNRIGTLAVTCGWGTVTVDDVEEDHRGTSKYSDNLHCMSVILQDCRRCNSVFESAGFTKKLMCAEALDPSQKTTWVIPLQLFCVINIIS